MERIFHIKNESGNHLPEPVLSLCIGTRHCCFSITNRASGDLQQLTYYTADEVNEPFLTEVFTACPELNASFHQVLVCYDHPESSLVPVKYYRQEDSGQLLEALYGVNKDVTILAEPIESWQLFNVFSVPKELHERISRKFMSRKYLHRYTLDLKNISGTEGRECLKVDLRKDDFTVLASGKNRFFLAKTYTYLTPADVIYYLLKICQQFGFSQHDVSVELSGLVDHESALFRVLDQYFLQVKFREANWTIPDNMEFLHPPHFFASLNDLAVCAL